jgi:uncharacterized HAD superfamily protein
MKHKPKILNVDIDNTLTIGNAWTPEECLKAKPRPEVIEWVNKQYLSNYIVIHTARRNELYMATMEWLNKHNVRFHATSFEKTPGLHFDLDAINNIKKDI